MDAHAWDDRYAATRQWSAGPNRFVAETLADLPPGRALDLGCGEGRNAVWLAARGWSVTAVDFSARGIERGRRAADDAGVAVDWVVGDALTETLPPVELVVLAYLQLPADERRAVIRRAREALSPGGTFFLVAHDSTNLTEGSGGPQDARVLYTAADVVADLGATCEIVRAERVAREVPQDDEHGGVRDAVAWDALVHARTPAQGA